MTVYIRSADGAKFWRLDNASHYFVEKYDNGAIVSCGLTVGEYGLTEKVLKRAGAVEVSKEEWNHSGCQSSCTRRGGKECRW